MTILILIGVGVLTFILTRILLDNGPVEKLFWVVGCGLGIILSLTVFLVGRRLFRSVGSPLVTIMDAADQVAASDLSVHVPEYYPAEFGNLARSFNRMTSELVRADEQRRHLVADVAHELRTPLHIIQGNLEGILDGVYQPNSETINATLDETRQLARRLVGLAPGRCRQRAGVGDLRSTGAGTRRDDPGDQPAG